jgi:hypothetical protein
VQSQDCSCLNPIPDVGQATREQASVTPISGAVTKVLPIRTEGHKSSDFRQMRNKGRTIDLAK